MEKAAEKILRRGVNERRPSVIGFGVLEGL